MSLFRMQSSDLIGYNFSHDITKARVTKVLRLTLSIKMMRRARTGSPCTSLDNTRASGIMISEGLEALLAQILGFSGSCSRLSLSGDVCGGAGVCMCGKHSASPLTAENHRDNYKAIHIQTLSGSPLTGNWPALGEIDSYLATG